MHADRDRDADSRSGRFNTVVFKRNMQAMFRSTVPGTMSATCGTALSVFIFLSSRKPVQDRPG